MDSTPVPADTNVNSITEGRTMRNPQDTFTEGMHFGSRIATKVAVQAIATAALNVLGKDGADGIIDLGALGGWHAADDGHGSVVAVMAYGWED